MGVGVGKSGESHHYYYQGKPPRDTLETAPRSETHRTVVKETPRNTCLKHEWALWKILGPFAVAELGLTCQDSLGREPQRASESQGRAGIQFTKMQLEHKIAGAHPLYKGNPTEIDCRRK